jgi:hypothetical protein
MICLPQFPVSPSFNPHRQSELSEQNQATLVGEESLFAMLDDELGDHDELIASRSSDALLLGSKTDEDLILEMEEFIYIVH